ncbi:hypothetical protein SAMN04487770_12819 [Butyrivibrio sp. ob235]|uniref:hypothetical protein n=1 Tax=Butyrivibrio sp. ob235 TaxID=1761780 RepID=UPI0008B8F300|nr:hypothetical protein [Butyrivibrio sp. ob235]SEM18884.1 hypothetical protein SAMN04487770_12819 [Butyrivibrio sp. ob235]
MESILIFIITIIVLAYKYLKENKGKIFAIVNKLGLKIISIFLISILVLAIIIENVTQKLLNELEKQNAY